MTVVVTGIGLVSALGLLEPTWKKLLAGQSGIRLQQPFEALGSRPLGLINEYPSTLEGLTKCVVEAALADAGLVAPLPDCAVVVGSSRGNQGRWERLLRQRPARTEVHGLLERAEQLDFAPEPRSWLETLPHAAAMTTARLIATQSAVRSPMAACATGLWAIAQGYELIRSGVCEQVIAGAVEAPITPLTLVGFERMGALATTGAYPFDCDREGLVLGEGGAVFVLETAALAKKRRASVYGRILGFGLTADGYHVSAPEPQSLAAIAAVRQCLQRSRLQQEQVDFIHAHGTATRLNDLNEARLIQHLFSSAVPVSSTKGATGHTIGASGALGVAFSLLSLTHQLLPPTVGLTQPEFDLNFVTMTQPATVQTVLCFSFGFGGQNAAIALGAA